jgi:hypothetical protein
VKCRLAPARQVVLEGHRQLLDEMLPRVQQVIRKRVRSATLLGAGGLVPDVVGDGRGRHGEARFAGGGRSYD